MDETWIKLQLTLINMKKILTSRKNLLLNSDIITFHLTALFGKKCWNVSDVQKACIGLSTFDVNN